MAHKGRFKCVSIHTDVYWKGVMPCSRNLSTLCSIAPKRGKEKQRHLVPLFLQPRIEGFLNTP